MLGLARAFTRFRYVYNSVSLASQKQRDITFNTQRSQLTGNNNMRYTQPDGGRMCFWVSVYWCMEQHHFPRLLLHTANLSACVCVCVRAREYLALLLKSKCVVNGDDDDDGNGSSVNMREWQQRLEPTTITKHENKTDALTQITENLLDNNYNGNEMGTLRLSAHKNTQYTFALGERFSMYGGVDSAAIRF